MNDKIKVMIVDDDPFICSSLQTILVANDDIRVVALANCGKEAIDTFKVVLPDILLMDIRMSDMTGIVAGEKILNQFPDAKIIFLTTFSDDEYIVKALTMGAKGYLIKQDVSSIVSAIRSAYAGQHVFGNEVVGRIVSMGNINKGVNKNIHNELSIREIEIIAHVAKGLNNKEIADILYLSEGTVRNYISSAREKLDLRDRTQLAIYYFERMKV